MVQDILQPAKPKMEAAIAHFVEELKTVRTGRANAAMLDGVMVSYYGTMTPLRQMATIATPEPTQLLIQPYDASAVADVRKAIVDADLGFNPSDDGKALRIIIPPLTAERREEYVKKANKMAEQARIAVRNIRGEIWESIQKAQKEGVISEDNRDFGRDDIDKTTAEFNKKIEELTKEKEAELRAI